MSMSCVLIWDVSFQCDYGSLRMKNLWSLAPSLLAQLDFTYAGISVASGPPNRTLFGADCAKDESSLAADPSMLQCEAHTKS